MIDSNLSMSNCVSGMAVVAWLVESLLLLLLLSKLSPPGLISPPSGVVVSVVSSMVLQLVLISPSMAVVVSIPPPMVVVVPTVASMVLPLGLLSQPATVVVLMFGAGGIGELAVHATDGSVDRERVPRVSSGCLFPGLQAPLPSTALLVQLKEWMDWTGTRRVNPKTLIG